MDPNDDRKSPPLEVDTSNGLMMLLDAIAAVDNQTQENPNPTNEPPLPTAEAEVARPQTDPAPKLIMIRSNETQVAASCIFEFSPEQLRGIPIGQIMIVTEDSNDEEDEKGTTETTHEKPSSTVFESLPSSEPGFSGAASMGGQMEVPQAHGSSTYRQVL